MALLDALLSIEQKFGPVLDSREPVTRSPDCAAEGLTCTVWLSTSPAAS
jgi:hypothetical protein